MHADTINYVVVVSHITIIVEQPAKMNKDNYITS